MNEITLHQFYAAHALAGLLTDAASLRQCAEQAYMAADEMMVLEMERTQDRGDWYAGLAHRLKQHLEKSKP